VHTRRSVLRGFCFNAVGACILGCFGVASCASGSNDPLVDYGDSGPPVTTEDSGTPGTVDPDSGSPSSSDDSGTPGSMADANPGTERDSALATDSSVSNLHDSAAPIDSGGPDTAAPDTGTSSDDSGVTPACGGIPQWVAGTTAQEVQNMSEKYSCIQPGWCDLGGVAGIDAYEPGVGYAWTQAWQDSGPCN
jgi:hypothetical protein